MLKQIGDENHVVTSKRAFEWSKRNAWTTWWIFSSLLLLILGFAMITEDTPATTLLLPGETTHGHYQIEMSCSACHTPMMGVKQDACLNCHEEELKLANDTHPAKKFNNPTNADRLAVLDAQKCITCHREHVPERTHSMGLSLPSDYCYHCHQDIKELRPSHVNYTFNSCASAGCHNYHDNTALYENFLAKHWGEPETLENPTLPERSKHASKGETLSASQQDAPSGVAVETAVVSDWAASAHAKAGVNCTACHITDDSKEWRNTVSIDTCKQCHETAVKGFLTGRHGMRIAAGLPPMEPQFARQPMKNSAAHEKLSCSSCHSSHRYDTRYAAVDACVRCHDDKHSRAYRASKHYQLWIEEGRSEGAAGTGVSCATCHLPRLENDEGHIFVMHNQNHNLRPNEKMVRSVCKNCHGVEFAIDSLADQALIDRCFDSLPAKHIKSAQMAKEWFETKERQKKSKKRNQSSGKPLEQK